MVAITRIETIRSESLPLLLWVRIHTQDGHVGLGETFYGPETVEAAIHEMLAPLLIGRDHSTIDLHWSNMFRLVDHFGYGGAELRGLSAIDTALWDVAGQVAGRPIYDLLGGASRDRIKIYDTYGGPDYYDDPLPYAADLLARGIDVMKVNAFPEGHPGDGYELTPELLRIITTPMVKIASEFGGKMRMAVDGHGFWSLHAAQELLRAFEDLPIYWIEELMSPRRSTAVAQLRHVTKHPICLSERLLTRYQYVDYLERGLADVVMPDLVWTGGISETKRIATLAETYQLPVAPHDSTGPVNMFACAHVSMNIPNALIMESTRAFYGSPGDFGTWDRLPGLGMTNGWYNEIVDVPIDVRDGYLLAPTNPGLGTALRPEFLKRPDVRVRASSESRPHHIRWQQ